MNLRRGLLAAAALPVALLGLASPASAVAGDNWNGCTTGGGCEMQIWTNACPKSSTFQLNVWEELDTKYQQLVFIYPGCTARSRERMVNSAGTGYVTTGWATATNNTGSAQWYLGHRFVAKDRCWSEWAVRRKDGSYYTRYHYNYRFNTSATFRELCTDA